MKNTFFICLFFSLACYSFAQNPLWKQWDRIYGGTKQEFVYNILSTPDDGYIIGSTSFSGISGNKTTRNWDTVNVSDDLWIMKLDGNGGIVWQKSYGTTSWDHMSTIQPTSDGGYIIGAQTSSGISGDKTTPGRGIHDYWILKLDSLGAKEWDKGFGGSGIDAVHYVFQTSDGGYLAIGESDSDSSGDKTEDGWSQSTGSFDVWIIKMDSAGHKQWDKDFGGINDDRARAGFQTKSGNYIIGGTSSSGISGNKTQSNFDSIETTADIWLIETDPFGNMLWDKCYGGDSIDIIQTVLEDDNGGYIIYGSSISDISGNKTEHCRGDFDYWIVTIDSAGVKQSEKAFGGNGRDVYGNLIKTSDGGFLVTGSSYSPASGEKSENNLGIQQVWTVKTDSAFNMLWDRTLLNNCLDQNVIAVQGSDQSYVFASASSAPAGGDQTSDCFNSYYDTWVIKFYDRTLITSASAPLFSNESAGMSIYPNPATSQFAVCSSQFTKDSQLEIFNSLGEKIYTSSYRDRLTVNCELFPSGIYFVRINNTVNQFTQKLFIK